MTLQHSLLTRQIATKKLLPKASVLASNITFAMWTVPTAGLATMPLGPASAAMVTMERRAKHSRRTPEATRKSSDKKCASDFLFSVHYGFCLCVFGEWREVAIVSTTR